jgi:Tweety
LADFCMNPTNNLLTAAPAGTTYDIVSYYSTCVGTDPLTGSLSGAQDAINTLYSSITDLYLVCPAATNPNLVYAQNNLTYISQTLYDIGNTTACPPLQYQVDQVLETGFCNNGFTGFYIFWAGAYVAAAGLFFATIVVSIVYQVKLSRLIVQ